MEIIYQKGEIARITFNRPHVLNALSRSMLGQLYELLQLDHKVVIITGEGKAFVAGADIGEMEGMTAEQWNDYCRLGRKVFSLLENGPFVSIAAVNGFAFGGGMELAMACDLVVASESATFGMPEVKLGVIPSFEGIPRLLKAAGKNLAGELLMTGRNLSATEVKALVNRVCAPDQLLNVCEQMAQEIVKNSFEAVLGVKEVMRGADEEAVSLRCFAKDERKERMGAFLKRRGHA